MEKLYFYVGLAFVFNTDVDGNILIDEDCAFLKDLEKCEIISEEGPSGGNPEIAIVGTMDQINNFCDHYFQEGMEAERADLIEGVSEYNEDDFVSAIKSELETLKMTPYEGPAIK